MVGHSASRLLFAVGSHKGVHSPGYCQVIGEIVGSQSFLIIAHNLLSANQLLCHCRHLFDSLHIINQRSCEILKFHFCLRPVHTGSLLSNFPDSPVCKFSDFRKEASGGSLDLRMFRYDIVLGSGPDDSHSYHYRFQRIRASGHNALQIYHNL